MSYALYGLETGGWDRGLDLGMSIKVTMTLNLSKNMIKKTTEFIDSLLYIRILLYIDKDLNVTVSDCPLIEILYFRQLYEV